jgi:tRNA(Ile2) C34 agmatinyltransferase TiaS
MVYYGGVCPSCGANTESADKYGSKTYCYNCGYTTERKNMKVYYIDNIDKEEVYCSGINTKALKQNVFLTLDEAKARAEEVQGYMRVQILSMDLTTKEVQVIG